MKNQASTVSDSGVRWWPVITLLSLAAVVLLWIWGSDFSSRQNRIIATLATGLMTFLGLVLWLLALSRLRRSIRLGAVAVLALAIALSFAAIEIKGFSGDMLPIVDWRWANRTVDRATSEMSEGNIASPAIDPARDYPQYLGPHRNATVHGLGLARDWQSHPPRELWRRSVGSGWSGFAVVGDYAVTLEQRGEEETAVCYDLTSGAVRWSHADPAAFAEPLGGPGPRSTPAIAAGRVFTQGATGILNALDLISGRLLWTRNIAEDNGSTVPTYGFAGSPLILDDLVVVIAGGGDGHSLVAYDAASGERRWSGGDDPAAYSSPVLATLVDVPQILTFSQLHLNGHDTETGRVLWRATWPRGTEKTSQPLVLSGDRVFLSSGYGIGAKLFQIRRDDTGDFVSELLWESPRLKAKLTNVVEHNGYLYGLDDGVLVCLDPADGERCWKRGRFGHGHVILADDLLIVQSEKGEVALIAPNPESYEELGRFQAVRGKSWNTPTLAGRHLLIRNAEEAACFELPTDA